ncbi:hypothetical protein [Brazilian marseillevirus]|uniref:hypothetical protein n=1 Tax=Brazilian marseillevirus TaxID=1813599 RepID=UPI0007846326|nr:hypothetical protein A3303_gp086 [Brazilian marseillevirus]AMQ10594.1 hypothetical protein [Brazilian marseillevirus]
MMLKHVFFAKNEFCLDSDNVLHLFVLEQEVKFIISVEPDFLSVRNVKHPVLHQKFVGMWLVPSASCCTADQLKLFILWKVTLVKVQLSIQNHLFLSAEELRDLCSDVFEMENLLSLPREELDVSIHNSSNTPDSIKLWLGTRRL